MVVFSNIQGRSSSIAAPGTGGDHTGLRMEDGARRFSVDSLPRHRRLLRIFRKENILSELSQSML